MTEWQDIETAPECAEQILTWSPVHGIQMRPSDVGYWKWARGAKISRAIPTHWMPLPEPPKPEDSNRQEGEREG